MSTSPTTTSSVSERLPPPPVSENDDDDVTTSAATSGKRKRVVLSILDKQTVLARLAAGEMPATVARAFDISRQQISDIKKNRERILAICADARHASSLRRKTLTPSSEFHPGVEQALYRWLVRQRRLGRAVSSDALAAMASELFVQFATDASGISFKTVANWLRHFKRAHGLKVLSDDELAHLPDRFVPAMDIMHPPASGEPLPPTVAAPSAAVAATANGTVGMGLATPGSTAAAPPIPISSDDYISGMSNMMALHAAANPPSPPQQQHVRPQQSHGAAESRHPLVSSAMLIQEIDAQLAFFEREVTAKLDDLDARVEKLCFLVLPPRFA